MEDQNGHIFVSNDFRAKRVFDVIHADASLFGFFFIISG